MHLLYGDESAIRVAKGFNNTEVERLTTLWALGTAKVQKGGHHLLGRVAVGVRQCAGEAFEPIRPVQGNEGSDIGVALSQDDSLDGSNTVPHHRKFGLVDVRLRLQNGPRKLHVPDR